MAQRTFSIIKPDAVRKGYTAAILAEIEKAGFKIVSIKRLSISKAQAEGFYHVHAARPFFGELTDFMSSGPIFPMVLEKDNAIADLRKLMGATNPAQAEGFYHVHAARPFFGELTEFMSSGPIFPMVLEKDNAIADLRKLMGATNPAQAEEGTIRKKFAASIGENAIHGSDAEDTAAFEIGYFFAGIELK